MLHHDQGHGQGGPGPRPGPALDHDHDLDHDLDHDHDLDDDLDHDDDIFTKYRFSMVVEAVHGQQPKPIVEKLSCLLSFSILYPNGFRPKMEP